MSKENMVEVRLREGGDWYPVVELIEGMKEEDWSTELYPKCRISENQLKDWKHVFAEFERVQSGMRDVLVSDKGDPKAGPGVRSKQD